MSFDPLNFNDIRQYNFEPLTKTFTDPSEWLNLLAFGNASNNGLVTIAIWRGQYYTMVLDIINNQVVWHSPPGNAFAPVISQNGQHLAADIFGPRNNYEGWILKRDNGHFNFLGKIDPGDHSFTEGGSEVLSYTRIRDYSDTYNGGYVSTFNLLDPPMDFTSSFTKISEVTLPAFLEQSNNLMGITYDPYTNRLAIRYLGSLKLLDPTTMENKKTINGHQRFFSNNYIILSHGFVEAIE